MRRIQETRHARSTKAAEPSAPRHLIYISFFFPPSPSAAAVRASSHVRYLARQGWQVDVIAAKSSVASAAGCRSQFEVKGVTVHWIKDPRPGSWLRSRIAKSLRNPRSIAGPGVQAFLQNSESLGTKLVRRLIKSAGKLSGLWGRNLWTLGAVLAGIRVPRNHAGEVVLSSCGPLHCHVVGAVLTTVRRVPWVAEFRDPWADNQTVNASHWVRVVRRTTERFVTWRAVAIVTVSDGFRHTLSKTHRHKQIAVIMNGYEPNRFAGKVPVARRFGLTLVGNLYPEHMPVAMFLDGLRRANNSCGGLKPIRVRLIGTNPSDYLLHLANEYGVLQYLAFRPHVSHSEAQRIQAESPALLVFGPSRASGVGWIPVKAYEAMASARPLVAVAEYPGELGEIIRSCECGVVLSSSDDICSVLNDWRSKHEAGVDLASLFPGFLDHCSQYERRKQAARLETLLTQMLTR